MSLNADKIWKVKFIDLRSIILVFVVPTSLLINAIILKLSISP